MCIHGVPDAEAVGSVLWPVVVSQPDTAYAVGVLSQFIQNPGQAHWEALKHVIMYLRCTKDLWLTFGGHTTTQVQRYCDADWASQKHYTGIPSQDIPSIWKVVLCPGAQRSNR